MERSATLAARSLRFLAPAVELGQQRHLLAIGERRRILQALDLFAKGVNVLKAAVHRGEPHISDLVEVAQLFHDPLAERARTDLARAARSQTMQQLRDALFETLDRDRSLFERAQHAAAQLVLVEGLAPAIALHDGRQRELRSLEGGETLGAAQAFAATAHGVAFAREPRVDDLGVLGTAKWTAHMTPQSGPASVQAYF